MFEYITGKLITITPIKAVLEQGGIGYLLFIPLNIFSMGLKLGEERQFYISCVIREDSHKLYGFLSKEERDLFELLNEISGIGPKTSLALIGHLGPNELEDAILQANLTLLGKVPGIGKKTAERLVIELKDRLRIADKNVTLERTSTSENSLVQDALGALTHLGYHPLQAHKAIKVALEKKGKDIQLPELITAALKECL